MTRSRVRRLVGVLIALGALAWALLPVLTVKAEPLSMQPAPDTREYADAAWQLAHGHGYVMFYNEHKNGFYGHVALPPRYPFGTSVALAPFAGLISKYPESVQIGSRVISALYVLSVILAAWLLGGPVAATIAALLVGSSPFAHVSASLILSDALAAMLTVGILIVLKLSFRGAAVAAGALAGALICVRLLGLVSLPAALLAMPGRRAKLLVLAGAAPLVGALALYQWHTFGSPFLTGYNYWLPSLHPFSGSFVFGQPLTHEGPFVYPDRLNGSLLSWLCPCAVGGAMTKMANAAFYPVVAAGFFWVMTPPLTGIIGFVAMIRRRLTPTARYALITVVLNLILVAFYFYSAARFIAPAVSLLIVYASVEGSSFLSWLRRRWNTGGGSLWFQRA